MNLACENSVSLIPRANELSVCVPNSTHVSMTLPQYFLFAAPHCSVLNFRSILTFVIILYFTSYRRFCLCIINVRQLVLHVIYVTLFIFGSFLANGGSNKIMRYCYVCADTIVAMEPNVCIAFGLIIHAANGNVSYRKNCVVVV